MRKALHMLGILNDTDVEWIATKGSIIVVRAGATLITEKQPIDSIYILLDGVLTVSVGTPSPRHLATLLPGEIVGEISFVDSRPPSASVIAQQDSQLLALSRESVTSKLSIDQGFSTRFYQAIAAFLADRLYVTVGRFGYGSASQDVAVDELIDPLMDQVSFGAARFDKLLQRFRGRAAQSGMASL